MNLGATINQNAATCIQSANDFGVTHYHNICTGIATNVPWGTSDWALVGLLIFVALFFCFVMLGMGVVMIKDMR